MFIEGTLDKLALVWGYAFLVVGSFTLLSCAIFYMLNAIYKNFIDTKKFWEVGREYYRQKRLEKKNHG